VVEKQEMKRIPMSMSMMVVVAAVAESLMDSAVAVEEEQEEGEDEKLQCSAHEISMGVEENCFAS
jgi:hypothetical protein